MGKEFQQVGEGFKGQSFLDVGMIVAMYCGKCTGDGCAECDGEGTVLVRILAMEQQGGELESNDAVQVEATLTYDQVIPHPGQQTLDFHTEKPTDE